MSYRTLFTTRDALVLAHPRPHRAVQLLVGGVDHHARGVQQRDLVARLDHPRLLQQLLAVDDLDPRCLQREQHGRLDRVDADRLARARRASSSTRIFSATSSARPDDGDIAPRSVEMPARERPSPSHGL
jgi:hypothetical protein